MLTTMLLIMTPLLVRMMRMTTVVLGMVGVRVMEAVSVVVLECVRIETGGNVWSAGEVEAHCDLGDGGCCAGEGGVGGVVIGRG